MGAATRDLLPFAVGRARSETVTVVTLKDVVLQDDGSASFYKEELQMLARVVALTSNEIERLQAGGLTINQGVSVAIVGELAKCPESIIRADGTIVKIVKFTIEEGATVMIGDVAALGSDGPTYQSGYSTP